MTLTDFLMARIAEDEQAARDDGADAMVGARWKHYPADAYEEIQSTTLTRCRRVLAECEAKRRIVECYRHLADDPDLRMQAWTFALKCLALPYADHPDYREEWRP